MKSEWVKDISDMHNKYGVHDWVREKIVNKDAETLQEFLNFRVSFLDEELRETKEAVRQRDEEEVIDGLIDLCVIAIGTLDILGVDSDRAWKEVHKANMSKKVGVKESRPNPFGVPDMIKPNNWKGPNHSDNIGNTEKFLYKHSERWS